MANRADTARTERRILGGAVRRIRELQNRTLADIGGQAGISEGYLSRIENNLRGSRITLGKMVNLANALGVDLADITYSTTVIELSEIDEAAESVA